MGGGARNVARAGLVRYPSSSVAPAAVALRDAQLADAPRIAAIEAGVFSDPWPVNAFSELLLASHTSIRVAVDQRGRIVGYCISIAVVDQGEIANIAVKPSSRRRGVAGRLLDDAVETSRKLGVTQIFLEVRTSNDAARELYRSRGFAIVGRRSAYYRNPLEDALLLRWDSPVPSGE